MTSSDLRTSSDRRAATPGALPEGMGDALATASLGLARRFAAGATLWCVSPMWPHHARHVAVEFVHPVIVGKRALPALLVQGDDLVDQLRVAVRPGDVVLAVAPAADRQVTDAMRRTDAWGVESIWVGAGPRPATGLADHVLFWEDAPETAPFDGRFLLLYHVLWELTSVCFDHPGLLHTEQPDDATEQQCTDDVCITCSDEGRVAEVVAATASTADVLAGGRLESIDTTLVGALSPGDLVLVHAGSAITQLDGGSIA